MIFPIPWAALHDTGLLIAVCGLLAGVAWAVYATTSTTIKRERDAWLIAQLPEISQHEILSARRERDDERARAERAEKDLADLRLQLEAIREAEEQLRQAAYNVAQPTVGHVMQMSGRRRR